MNIAYMGLKWFLTLYASTFPPALSLRVYDLFIADGHITALRVAMLTLGDVEEEWISMPSGDPRVLTPRLWHNLEAEDKLRPFWETDPDEIVKMVRAAPPTVAEFVELRKRYVLMQKE